MHLTASWHALSLPRESRFMYRCIVAFELDFLVASEIANRAIINRFIWMNLFEVFRQAGIMSKLRAADSAFKRHFSSMDEHVGGQIVF